MPKWEFLVRNLIPGMQSNTEVLFRSSVRSVNIEANQPPTCGATSKASSDVELESSWPCYESIHTVAFYWEGVSCKS